MIYHFYLNLKLPSQKLAPRFFKYCLNLLAIHKAIGRNAHGQLFNMLIIHSVERRWLPESSSGASQRASSPSICDGPTERRPELRAPVSLKVNLPLGTCGELTASPNPSVRRGTYSVGVLGTMPSSPVSS